MAITAQFRPTQHVYTPTYQPLPWEKLGPVAMQMQQEHMAGLQQYADVDSGLEEVTSASPESDKAAVQELVAGYKGDLEGLLKNSPEARSPEFQLGLRKVISKVKGNKFLQDTAHNAQMEQSWAKKLADPNVIDQDKFELEQEYAKYQKLGTMNYGKLAEPQVAERQDYSTRLEAMGKGFARETVGLQEGVRLDEVAFKYGLSQNADGTFNVDRIPEGFLKNEGQSLIRDAKYRAAVKGTDFQEELKALYLTETVPLVLQYSGMKDKIVGGTNVNVNIPDKYDVPSPSTGIETGVAVNIPGASETAQHISDRNAEDNFAIQEIDNQLATIDPDSPMYPIVEQRKLDIEADIKDRNDKLQEAKAELDYDNSIKESVLDGYFYYSPDTDYAPDEDLSVHFEPLAYGPTDEMIQLEDFDQDGILNIEDLARNTDAIAYYVDTNAGASTSDIDPTTTMSAEELRLYKTGERAQNYLQEYDKTKGLDVYKNVKKSHSVAADINNKLDNLVEDKFGTAEHSAFSFSSIAPQIGKDLADSYGPNKEQWVVMDTDAKGEIIGKAKKKPNSVEFKQFSTAEVPGLGHQIFDVRDPDTGKEYKVYNTSRRGDMESLGAEVMRKNDIHKDKNPGPNKINAFIEGFRMVHPGVASSVDRTNVGVQDPRPIYEPGNNRLLGYTQRLEKNGVEYWTVTYEKTPGKGDWITLGADPDQEGGNLIMSRNKVLAVFDAIMDSSKSVEATNKMNL